MLWFHCGSLQTERPGEEKKDRVESGSVSDRSTIALHEASFFKLAEWSEQLRPVTAVRLGAVRRRIQIRFCTEQRV